ncbi:hypothetical protein [Spirosoma rhododendri]|uniref:Uncharacterized protein n=1 Tax=Spirosoma rhododendri TaxID=2728024 RepID=A0A7L5DV61_9BACT|nr:hypothetical protein [Spirosoma rhododendri]QJD80488.1 hypothetical protein HH216_20205 [Spirosoma rhododendri]
MNTSDSTVPDGHSSPLLHNTSQSFAETNVNQLRDAVEQAVYGDVVFDKSTDPERAHTIEVLTTLGQMGELTETDLDEAKKEYL